MNLRNNIYFKPLCLLVAALFVSQCTSVPLNLVSTEEKVIENGIQAYVYELEKIKTPSPEDPTVEYKIVKFPANRIETINTYKPKKVNRISPIIGGVLIGAVIGSVIGVSSGRHHEDGEILGFYGGFRLGALIGGISAYAVSGTKEKKSGLIKKSAGSSLGKKPDSIPIPAQNLPLEFKWGTRGKSNSFKTQTDEQGFVRINLIDDLKMTKLPLDRPLTLCIHYLYPESQLKGILSDSLGPEK